MKAPIFLLAALIASVVTFAMPVAENVTFSQDAKHVVTITYTLTEAPAIVTLDIQTNVTGDVWASIGAANVAPGVTSDSEAYRKVTGAGTHTIKWCPFRSWLGESERDNLPVGKVRAVVTMDDGQSAGLYGGGHLGQGQTELMAILPRCRFRAGWRSRQRVVPQDGTSDAQDSCQGRDLDDGSNW